MLSVLRLVLSAEPSPQSDTYVIEDGKIAAQTLAIKAVPKK